MCIVWSHDKQGINLNFAGTTLLALEGYYKYILGYKLKEYKLWKLQIFIVHCFLFGKKFLEEWQKKPYTARKRGLAISQP